METRHLSRLFLKTSSRSRGRRRCASSPKRIGISDVGLKKLLSAQGTATPPQGHWNRLRAGRPVTAPPKPLPGGGGKRPRASRLAVPRPRARSSTHTRGGSVASRLVPEDLGELRALELKAIGKAASPRDSPGRRSEWRGSAEGSGAPGKSRGLVLVVGRAAFRGPVGQRQLRLLAGLLEALAKRGHGGEVWEDACDLRARCEIGEQTLGLRFEVSGSTAPNGATAMSVPRATCPPKRH